MNIALILPLFHEYGRRIRQGVLEWVDRNPGWRVIEIDPQEQLVSERLEQHLHGAITWSFQAVTGRQEINLGHIPVVDCGLNDHFPAGTPGPACVTFDRASINGIAVGHFRDLGLEVAGYVGRGLRKDGELVPRVADMRAAALAAGMEWVSYDVGDIDPAGHAEWLWDGHRIEGLVDFLRESPKPLGLLAQDDYMGVMLCEAANRLGIAVPGEIAVLGQGDRVVGRTGGLSLSSIVIPGHEVGMAAAALLDGWLKGSPPRPWRRHVPCTTLTVRRSTGGLSLDLGIERAKRHLDRHALDGVTVQELAVIAQCSPKTLRTRFSELYGLDISHTIRERRTEVALELLAESDLEIGEIGKRCGFPSAPNFFNFITRQTGGIGPADYRRRAREK
jgi:LacI family transcriptional regulator